jgi:hypothetical protein
LGAKQLNISVFTEKIKKYTGCFKTAAKTLQNMIKKYATLNNKLFKKIVFVRLLKIISCKGWNKTIVYLNTLFHIILK